MTCLTASQIVKHPAYAYIPRTFPPTRKGKVESVDDQGHKCEIAYEIHGQGPKKLVWVSGLGVIKWFWQRQCKDFGHDRGSEYSCLIFDNRGMGESGKPWMKYSMKMFAQDVVAIVDHIGWTNKRELNVVGASMGGMIVQELALLIPERIGSLILVSTGPRLINTFGWIDSLRRQFRVFVQEPLDSKLEGMKATFIGEKYASSPDGLDESVEGAPLFDTRGDRYIAEMAYMHLSPQDYTHWAWFRQLLAVVGWRMTDKDLMRIVDLVGRQRILAMHGTEDKGMPIVHNEELVKGMGGAGENGIKLVLLEGCGHIPPIEKREEFAELIRNFVDETLKLNDKH